MQKPIPIEPAPGDVSDVKPDEVAAVVTVRKIVLAVGDAFNLNGEWYRIESMNAKGWLILVPHKQKESTMDMMRRLQQPGAAAAIEKAP